MLWKSILNKPIIPDWNSCLCLIINRFKMKTCKATKISQAIFSLPSKKPSEFWVIQKMSSPAARTGPQAMLNPLKASFDEISHDIIGNHDSSVNRQDVDYLYNVVSNIVKNSTHVADFLDSKVNQGSRCFHWIWIIFLFVFIIIKY